MYDPLTIGIIGGSSILGAGLNYYAGTEQSKAIREAAQKQADTEKNLADKNWQAYLDIQEQSKPWRTAGENALARLQWEMGMTPENVDMGKILGLKIPAMPLKQQFMTYLEPYKPPLPGEGKFGTQAFYPRTKSFDEQAYNEAMTQYDKDKDAYNTALNKDFGLLNRDFVMNPEEDPSYNFRLNQGIDAIERSATGRGKLFSGQTLKDLMGYGEDYASQEYSKAYNRDMQEKINEYNRLAGLAGLGSTASLNLNNLGMNAMGDYGNLSLDAQNALNAGNLNATNAYLGGVQGLNNAITSGVGNLMQYQLLDKYLKG